jgi:hypothetical protein
MPALTLPLDPQGHAALEVLLAPAGSLSPVQAGQGAPLSNAIRARALIDPGATLTAIDPQIRRALHVNPFRAISVTVPGSTARLRFLSFKVDLAVPHPATQFHQALIVPALQVVVLPLAHTGSEVLIGCDILRRCQFFYDGPGNYFRLNY